MWTMLRSAIIYEGWARPTKRNGQLQRYEQADGTAVPVNTN